MAIIWDDHGHIDGCYSISPNECDFLGWATPELVSRALFSPHPTVGLLGHYLLTAPPLGDEFTDYTTMMVQMLEFCTRADRNNQPNQEKP